MRYEMIFKTVKELSIQDISNRKVGLKIIVINCLQLCVKNCKLGIRGSHKHGRICWHHIWTAQESFVSARIFDREIKNDRPWFSIFHPNSKLWPFTIHTQFLNLALCFLIQYYYDFWIRQGIENDQMLEEDHSMMHRWYNVCLVQEIQPIKL